MEKEWRARVATTTTAVAAAAATNDNIWWIDAGAGGGPAEWSEEHWPIATMSSRIKIIEHSQPKLYRCRRESECREHEHAAAWI